MLDEVERLLREYKQNQELLKRVGSRYYQVVYPIQVWKDMIKGLTAGRQLSLGQTGETVKAYTYLKCPFNRFIICILV